MQASSAEGQGIWVADPQNPAIKPQRWPNTSILHVPSNPTAL